jgi:dUTP pyrophosphatase
MKINIKKLEPEAIIPTKGSDAAAGVDLYAPRALVIHPGSNGVINTGLAIEIPDGYFGAIFARSGMATRKGLRPANCVGVIDSDYRGEIIVVLHNDTDIIRPVQEGDRIAQLVILPYEKIEFSEVEELTDTERADGGFGSTGN